MGGDSRGEELDRTANGEWNARWLVVDFAAWRERERERECLDNARNEDMVDVTVRREGWAKLSRKSGMEEDG